MQTGGLETVKTLRERIDNAINTTYIDRSPVENIAQAVKAWLNDNAKEFESKAALNTFWYLQDKIDREGAKE